jgi:L-fuconolactonase
MRIDAHNHFWLFNKADYGWIDDSMALLRDDFTPQRFRKVLDAAGIDGTIAVQARQSLEETRWLLQLAEANDFIKGVIGWVDLCSPQLQQQLQEFEGCSKLKGFRHVLQDEPDDSFMLQPAFIDGIKLLADIGYCYEILVFARQLGAVQKLLQQLPEMRLVIDHIAKPDLKEHSSRNWFGDMHSISAYPNVYCKLSGMVTEADWNNWNAKDIRPYIDHVIQRFGGERVMFGSDWPVCLVAADYLGVKALVEEYLNQHYPQFKNNIFGLNASRFYQIR